jgi:pyruvate dehydrogenase E1 component beta subunit
MPKKSYRQAINEAIRQEMERDPRVILMGEDVAGGAGAPGEQDAWGGPMGSLRVSCRNSGATECSTRRSLNRPL